MTKNIKSIFFVLTLVMLLVTVGAVCAADDADSNIATDSSVNDAATVTDTNSNQVATESATTKSNDNYVDTKTVEKEVKNIKTSTETVEVNNIDELTNTINNAVNDAANEEYVINLNNGSYDLTSTIRFNNGQFSKNIIINANNQIFSTSNPNAYVFIQNNCNYTINNIILDQRITNNVNITFNNSQIIGGDIGNQNNANLTFINSYLNTTINNYANLVIDDNTEFGNNTMLGGRGNLTINNYTKILQYLQYFNGTFTIENTSLSAQAIWNYGNLTFVNVYFRPSQNIFNYANITFKNCTVECNINNNMNYDGIITISDDTILADNITIANRGTIIINDTSRILPLLTSYNGTYTFNNMNLSGKSNRGNLTLNECNITGISNYGNLTTNNCYYSSNGRILNYGQHIINNSTLNDIDVLNYNDGNLFFNNCVLNCRLQNAGTVYISEDTILGNSFQYSGNGVMICNDTSKIISYVSSLSGNNSISNITLSKDITNNGNLTVTNCTLNSTITNNGNLTISDDTILAENFQISGSGEIIINDTDRLLPYMTTYNGTYTFDNIIFNREKTNNGNLTINNSLINNAFYNYGNLTLDNTVINKTSYSFYNYGNLTMNNSMVNKTVYNYQNMEMENSIINYTVNNNGNLTLKNTTNNQQISNNGNLSMYDSVQNANIQNRNGNLTVTNCTLNSTITNNGNLTISDDTILAENFQITGNGQIIINDTNRLIPYMTTYNGNYTIENMTITSQKTNTGNLTITNSTINSQIINRGNLTIKNTTLNSTLSNVGTTIISDDTVFTENFRIGGNGEVIINDTDRLIPYLAIYNGNYTIKNATITSMKTNIGNLTYIDCDIKNKITNNGNLTFINCSFCDLPYIEKTWRWNGYTIYGFESFIVNNANANTSLINCSFCDNNMSANYTHLYSPRSNGILIENYGSLVLNNTEFRNNSRIIYDSGRSSVGYEEDSGGWVSYLYDDQYVNGYIINGTGNISIDNCSFTDNTFRRLIRNAPYYRNPNDNSTTVVYNSKFDNNTAVLGSSIVIADNCNFTNIYSYFESHQDREEYGGGAEGGIAIASSKSSRITNCNFINSTAYTKGSTSFSGASGGAIGIGSDSIVDNCTFINTNLTTESIWVDEAGDGGAIYASGTNITISNNYFQNNSVDSPRATTVGYFDGGVTGSGGAIFIGTNNATIKNNIFSDTSAVNYGGTLYVYCYGNISIENNTLSNSQSGNEAIYFDTSFINMTDLNKTMTNNTYNNCSISFNKLKISSQEKIYDGETVEITAEMALTHPLFYDEDIFEKSTYNYYINGETINYENVNITITPTTDEIVTYTRPSISTQRSNILVIGVTTLTNVTITPENYDTYVVDGELIRVQKDSRVLFNGNFENKDLYITTHDIIIDGKNANFTNSTFLINAENVTIQNMHIQNQDNDEYIINTIANNTIIQNNTLTQYNSNGKTTAIKTTNTDNVIIQYNNLNVTGPAKGINYGTETEIATTQTILTENTTNLQIIHNTLNVQNSTLADGDAFSTIEAITSPHSTNAQINYNNITATGARFNYGINTLNNVNNQTIAYNNIKVTGHRYTDGIQIGNGATNNIIKNNNINLTCINSTPVDEAAISYGIIVTSNGGLISENNTVTENNIEINGIINYGMELYATNNNTITKNNITLNGSKSIGIGYALSPNSIATDNKIIINDDSTIKYNPITEEIQPLSTGIRIQQDSSNILIENNTIITNDSQKQDTTINSEDKNITIKNNQLTSSQGYGDETINAPITANKENNIIETTTTLAVPESIATNTPITLTATVTTADGTPINGGTVTFTKGNEAIAQTTVTDGIATATITFTQEEEDVTIVASYTPTSTGLSTSSAEAATTIEAPVTQLNIEEIDMTAGETVTLTARVTDQNGNNLNGGKVSFKVNGKTVKDANGKVVYAKVVDGVATAQYTVPENLGGQDINITAVYSGTTKYNKETTTITTTVTAPEAKLTITPITSDVQTGSTVTLKAKVAIGYKAITTGKIVFKVNGKTVKDTNGKVIYAKVDANGEVNVDYTIPESFKAGTYNIEAVFIASGYEKLTDNTTMTVVKS